MYVIIELKNGLKSRFSFFKNQLFIQSLPSRFKTYSGRFSIECNLFHVFNYNSCRDNWIHIHKRSLL